ncbi:MAG: winged helix-turn-helix domain-containing protein [Puia sp.]|nr:winged helix-turn-helix domain-containing protein [Puia sp.]
MNNVEILLIDEEWQVTNQLQAALQSGGYRNVRISGADEGLKTAVLLRPDLILLDLGSKGGAGENGLQILMRIREWYRKPVIVVSSSSEEEDIVRALDEGANDYLVKPFRGGELFARIRSALRSTNMPQGDPLIQCRGLEIDLSSRTVKVNDEILKLTATQYDLLTLFGKNEGKTLTHQYLLREVWGPDYVEQTQYLRVFIAQLRKKIEKNADRPEYIITESGVGYRFVP